MIVLYVFGGLFAYLLVGHIYARLTLKHYLSTRSEYDTFAAYERYRTERDYNIISWNYLLGLGPMFWPVMIVWWVLSSIWRALIGSLVKVIDKSNPITIEKAAHEAERKAAAEAAKLLEDEYLTGIRIRPDADVDRKLTKPRGGKVTCKTCTNRFEGEFALEDARLHYRTVHDGWRMDPAPTS